MTETLSERLRELREHTEARDHDPDYLGDALWLHTFDSLTATALVDVAQRLSEWRTTLNTSAAGQGRMIDAQEATFAALDRLEAVLNGDSDVS